MVMYNLRGVCRSMSSWYLSHRFDSRHAPLLDARASFSARHCFDRFAIHGATWSSVERNNADEGIMARGHGKCPDY